MNRGTRLLMPALLLAVSAFGQETRATLSGTITDPSSAAVAGASLQLLHIQTGLESNTKSSSTGQYRFLYVNPGSYRLAVAVTGFRTMIRDGILLGTGPAGTLDVGLP